MSDITMCSGKGCSLKKRCYRFTAVASEFAQSYFAKPPILGDSCDYFWDNGETDLKGKCKKPCAKCNCDKTKNRRTK